MFLKSLYLRNFRNYSEAEVHLHEHLNIFHGDNAQGKTNLLEAIYLIATGRSFRTQSLSELVAEGQSFFFLEAIIVRDGVEQTLKVTFENGLKKLQMGANVYQSFHPLLGLLPSVLYTPYDIELITGPPNERRRFLNLHLAQSDPLYVHHLTCFWRAMKQRNCLLRSRNLESIECWEEKMAASANYINQARQLMLDEIKEPLASLNLTTSEEEHALTLSVSQGKNYLKQLQKNRSREMELGVTLTGPHRDDFSFLIKGKPAKSFASEGQKKTSIALLKLAEWQRLSKRAGEKVLMGFDDIEQHLDEDRQKSLRKHLLELGQVFITTPHTNLIEGHCLHIENGSVLI